MSRREEGATAGEMSTRRPDLGGRSTVFGTKGAVACEHPSAALAGIRILEAGGTAADACVAMAAAMVVLSPMQTGMGGDAFLLSYEAETGSVLGADGSGRAPAAVSIEKLRNRGLAEMPERGGPTITVPGAVRLWEDAATSQADLAGTLSAVAEGGADAFYGGEIARSLARSAQEAGGYLSEEDLAAHESTWVEPISTEYRGVLVHEIPPPGQGVAALEMLNILEGFDLGSLGPASADRIHLEVEAKKLAFEDLREKVGDPGFSEVPTSELISKDYAATLRGRISPERAAASVASDLGSETTYLCAVDAAGNGCSFINSLYNRFGSGIVAGGTGVCLHNRGRSFRLLSGHPNALAPGKRPLHTIIPGLATREGALWAVFGVMGALMQPQGHAQLLINLLDHGMSPQDAVDHPRNRHEDGTLFLERRVDEAEVDRLREMGHRVEVGADYIIPTGGAQLIRVHESGVRACGSDTPQGRLRARAVGGERS